MGEYVISWSYISLHHPVWLVYCNSCPMGVSTASQKKFSNEPSLVKLVLWWHYVLPKLITKQLY